MSIIRARSRSIFTALSRALVLVTIFPGTSLFAQNAPLRPGEAYVTRFSGTVPGQNGVPAINRDGTVGTIIDVRAPERPPQGGHWIDEPQRLPVTAAQVGQVFGVVLDDANPPNVYLASTAAFGLHHVPDTTQWMPGMWGPGGPGAIYRLDAVTGYAPRLLTRLILNGRANSGAALGNLAYDRFNKQLFVTDLETGMIHRIRVADGADLGTYDHGVDGRSSFVDAESSQPGSLPPIPFNPGSQARVNDCPGGFDNNPECWNLAASGRRVWGIAVHRDPIRNETRVYYSVWSSPAFGQTAWNQASEDDKRNSVWSIRLGLDGGFTGNVRREFIMPDFFVQPQDIARAGYSQPVSDITFAECGPRPIMLIAERGGMRNLGLAAPAPFAKPHEARALRYELDRNGAWRAIGRYDVGFYDRQTDGQPFERANCEGGIAFGLGYNTNTWVADPGKPDQFVWISGHSLCSPEAPCNLPSQASQAARPGPGSAQPASQQAAVQYDDSQVHGLQGTPERAFEEVSPESALAPYPQDGQSSDPAGPNQSYLIDTDINIDANGNVIGAELTRNDSTKIGDVAIYQICQAPTSYAQDFLLAPPVAGEGPVPANHYRYGSHDPFWSHNRFRSHNPYWSHNMRASHNRFESHNRIGSHNREESHRLDRSHDMGASHYREGSHDDRASHARNQSHTRAQSSGPVHNRTLSAGTGHTRAQSAETTHTTAQSGQTTIESKRRLNRTTVRPRFSTVRQPTLRTIPTRTPSFHGGGGFRFGRH